MGTSPFTPATRYDRTLGVGVGVFLSAVSLIGFRYGSVPFPELPGVIAAYGITVLILDFLTALVLVGQANLRGSLAVSRLAGAYIYSGIAGFAFTLTLPGVFSPGMAMGSGPQTAAWVWTFWHGGFPLLAATSLLTSSDESPDWRRRLAVLAGPGLAVAAIFVAIFAESWLPPLVLGGDYHTLASSPFGIILMTTCGLAVAFTAVRTRGRTAVDIGLFLALLANFLDVTVTLNGAVRFGLGWYLSKVESFMASGLVLSVLLSDLFRVSQRLAAANRELQALSASDSLTGLSNRRRLDEFLSLEWTRAFRYSRQIAVLMCDVDHFKAYNDRYGHQAGDECLRRVAASLQSAVRRNTDACARYGGEEFCVVLPETGAAEAAGIAETVRQRVEALALPHEGNANGLVTISIGVAAAIPAADETAADLLSCADKALYEAKRHGRNQVRTSSAT